MRFESRRGVTFQLYILTRVVSDRRSKPSIEKKRILGESIKFGTEEHIAQKCDSELTRLSKKEANVRSSVEEIVPRGARAGNPGPGDR